MLDNQRGEKDRAGLDEQQTSVSDVPASTKFRGTRSQHYANAHLAPQSSSETLMQQQKGSDNLLLCPSVRVAPSLFAQLEPFGILRKLGFHSHNIHLRVQ